MRTTPTLRDWRENSGRSLEPGTVVAGCRRNEHQYSSPNRLLWFDGKSHCVDAQLKNGLASTNKLLAAFASEADLALAIIYSTRVPPSITRVTGQNQSGNFNAVQYCALMHVFVHC